MEVGSRLKDGAHDAAGRCASISLQYGAGAWLARAASDVTRHRTSESSGCRRSCSLVGLLRRLHATASRYTAGTTGVVTASGLRPKPDRDDQLKKVKLGYIIVRSKA